MEAEFFRSLVRFTQAKEMKPKTFHFEEMKRLRGFREIKPIESAEFEFLSKWYHTAVRELVATEKFREDSKWVAKSTRPPITEIQAKKSLELLLKLNFIKRDSKGKLVQSSAALATPA